MWVMFHGVPDIMSSPSKRDGSYAKLGVVAIDEIVIDS
jgi:hypothetical protein